MASRNQRRGTGSRRNDPPAERRLGHWRADGAPKARYATSSAAERASLWARLEHGSDLHPYQCEFCGGWHLGSRPD
ncbi:MAG: hypothetical protein M0Z62_03125 [Actinomycetota bacterium]|nr:hypothetical protein [Actinomycetota bacterium]